MCKGWVCSQGTYPTEIPIVCNLFPRATAQDKSIPGEALLCALLLSQGAWWVPAQRLSAQKSEHVSESIWVLKENGSVGKRNPNGSF